MTALSGGARERLAIGRLTCDNEDGPGGVGSTGRGLTHLSDYGGRGLGVSLPSKYEPQAITRDEALRLTQSAATFWQKVNVGAPGECWPWTGAALPFGHGNYQSSVGRLAHRYAWALANLASPGDLLVRHRCDNPPCCNPRHLELGTHVDNAMDAVVRGRAEWTPTTCRKGHPRTPENTTIKLDGTRRCLVCERQARRIRKQTPGLTLQCWECSSVLGVHSLVRHLRKLHGIRLDADAVRARAAALTTPTSEGTTR